jgi:DNA-binding response OmpR family regulator
MLSKPEDLQTFLKKIKPDLFLLDYKMPGITGFELIPIIRAFPEHADTPILFLTSEGADETITQALQLGACDYVIKPFEKESLHDKIKKYLRSSSSRG